MAVLLPAGTPAQVIELLQRQTAAALARPEVKARLTDMGFDPTESTPDGLSVHMKAETAKWAKVVRDAGIKILFLNIRNFSNRWWRRLLL